FVVWLIGVFEYCGFFLLMVVRALMSRLFPYTALFRSVQFGIFGVRWQLKLKLFITVDEKCFVYDGHFLRPRRIQRRRRIPGRLRSEEHTSELQSQSNLVCRLLPEKKTELEAERAQKHK